MDYNVEAAKVLWLFIPLNSQARDGLTVQDVVMNCD